MPDRAGKRGGLADRAARIRCRRAEAETRGDGRRRAAGRSARHQLLGACPWRATD